MRHGKTMCTYYYCTGVHWYCVSELRSISLIAEIVGEARGPRMARPAGISLLAAPANLTAGTRTEGAHESCLCAIKHDHTYSLKVPSVHPTRPHHLLFNVPLQLILLVYDRRQRIVDIGNTIFARRLRYWILREESNRDMKYAETGIWQYDVDAVRALWDDGEIPYITRRHDTMVVCRLGRSHSSSAVCLRRLAHRYHGTKKGGISLQQTPRD